MPNSKELKEIAKTMHVKLTRKSPKQDKNVHKSDKELVKNITSKIKNIGKAPMCYKPTEAVAEKKLHNGKPCPKGEKRTKNYCVKELAPYDKEKTRWVRTVTPNKSTRITVVCPK